MIKKRHLRMLVSAVLILIFTMSCGFGSVVKINADLEDSYKEELDRIVDNAGILSDNEELLLATKIHAVRESTNLDYAIYTTYDPMGTKSNIRNIAREYYSESGYGSDSANSGTLLVVDMATRQVYLYTCGIAIWYIDEVDIEDILDDVQPELSDDSNYMACYSYLMDVSTLAQMYIEDEQEGIKKWEEGNYDIYDDFYDDYVKSHKNINHDLKNHDGLIGGILKTPWKCLLLCAVISAVIVFFIARSNRSKMTANGLTYMDKSTYNLKRKSDRYIRTTRTKRRMPKKSSSGGGGGSFSGGHGGGGRSF